MTTPQRIAVVVPWEPKRIFRFSAKLAAVSSNVVDTIGGWAPRRQTLLNRLVFIYPQYLFMPLRMLVIGRRYRYLVTWQQVHGIVLALLLRMMGVSRFSGVVIMTFILMPAKRRGLPLRLIRFALESPFIRRVIVFNENEMALYKALLPSVSEKFRYVLYTAADIEDVARFNCRDAGYFVAAGRSNRDYDFLIDFFRAHPEKKLIILSDQYYANVPPNVEVVGDAFDDRYYKYLSASHAVILPFKDLTASAGQLVFLHAIQLGKPVIATRSTCLDGYFMDGVHGFYVDKDALDLARAMEALENPQTYARLSEIGPNDYKRRFGFDPLALGIWQSICN